MFTKRNYDAPEYIQIGQQHSNLKQHAEETERIIKFSTIQQDDIDTVNADYTLLRDKLTHNYP
jgi:hypothetical protein